MSTPWAAPLPAVSRPAWLALAAIALATALLYWLYWSPYGVDDQWITYRYAENLAAGHGFVYNLGERVLGTSTPLYTGILALAGFLGLPVPQVSWSIGFVSMLASMVLLFLMVRRIEGETAGLLAAGLLASAQLFHRVATYGMETPLYVALILGTFVAYLAGRELLAAALAAACLLTRLDGGAVGVALMAVHVVTRRRLPLRPLIVYLALALPWFLFSQGYFGSLLPNTMLAKRLHTGHSLLLWMPRWLLREPRAWLALFGVVSLLAGAATRRLAAVPILWAGMYTTAYTLGQIQRYDWYQTPLVAILAGLAAVGIIRLAQRVVPAGRAYALVVVGLAAVVVAPDGYRALLRAGGDEGVLGLERLRYQAAIWMRDSLPPGVPIATGGIGMVGYFTGRPIHDAMGLVTPASMRLAQPLENPRAVPFPRFLPAVIEDFQPTYVFDGFWLKAGETMPDFMLGQYAVLREWRQASGRGPSFILYQRVERDSLASPAGQ